MLIYACIFNSQIFVLMCLKTYGKYCYKGGLQSCGPQGLNISGKWAKHFGPHPLSLSLPCPAVHQAAFPQVQPAAL